MFFIITISCNSEENDVNPGIVNINFNNKVGNEILNLQQGNYNKNGNETFSVDELKYIISNIVLIDAKGNEFVYPQENSYFLINEEVSTTKRIALQDINANEYTSIRFGIGVDQSRFPLNGVENFVPTAEENNMIWSWSAGYIFMRLEGLYSSTQVTNTPFKYHIGSHGQNLDNYREVSLNFMQPLAVSSSENAEIDINFDVLKLFSGEHNMLLQNKDDVQIDPENAPKIRDNYTNAFEIGLN